MDGGRPVSHGPASCWGFLTHCWNSCFWILWCLHLWTVELCTLKIPGQYKVVPSPVGFHFCWISQRGVWDDQCYGSLYVTNTVWSCLKIDSEISGLSVKLHWKFWERIGNGGRKCAQMPYFVVQHDLKPHLSHRFIFSSCALFLCTWRCGYCGLGKQRMGWFSPHSEPALVVAKWKWQYFFPAQHHYGLTLKTQLYGAKFLVLAYNCGLGTNFWALFEIDECLGVR